MSPPERPPTLILGIESEALDWFVRRTGGHSDAREEAAFQGWLEADAEHRNAYARQQAEWAALGRLPAAGLDILRSNLADDLAAEAALAASVRSTATVRPASVRRRPSRPANSKRRRLLLHASSAAAIALMAGGLGLVGWNHWQAQPIFAQSFSTARGQQLDAVLPDGSRLRLDTATRLEVTYYRHRREVRLPEGQVAFSVQGDATRPFEVTAGPLRVTVVGTRFSVRHTPGLTGNDGVRVAVEAGRVKVEQIAQAAASRTAAPAIFLSAGQQISGDAQGVLEPVVALSTAGIAPWRDNRVSFDNARLDQVLAELERYGSTRLMVRDPDVAGLRITGTFNPTRLDNFAKVLPQAAPVRLRETAGVTEIVRTP